MLTNKTWWKAALIRAAKTFAQAAVGVIPAAVTIADVDWVAVVYTASFAAVLSVLTSLAGLPEISGETYGFWKAAGYRAVKTVFQTAVAALPAAALITEVNWLTVAGAALLAGVVSLLMSVAGLAVPEIEDAEEKAGNKDQDLDPYDHGRITFLNTEENGDK